jgi:hypothetical protein
MAAVPQAWRPASEAHGGLSGSRPTAEAARPASVRPAAEAARWLALAGKVGGASTLAQRRRCRARGKGPGLTLAATQNRGRSSGIGAEAVAGVGEERAPVSGRAVLWLEAEAREVTAVRRQSGMKT